MSRRRSTRPAWGRPGRFLVSIFTSFRGAAQLGIIAGGGLLLCLLAGYVVLPALLTIFPPRIQRNGDSPAEVLGKPARGNWAEFSSASDMAGAPCLREFHSRCELDSIPNLIELQAPNLESVKLVRKLETWSSVLLSHDLDALRRAREAVRSSFAGRSH